MPAWKNFNNLKFARPLKGGLIALVLALVVQYYLTQIAPDSRLTELAYNSKVPFLMIFSFSMLLVCIPALKNDVLGWLTGVKPLTPEQLGMVGIVILSAFIFLLLFFFQECREINIEFHASQPGDIKTIAPGSVFEARLGSPVTVLADDQANTAIPFDCQWQSSITGNGVKISPLNQCKTTVKTDHPGVMILTVSAHAPRCSSQVLAPLTIRWH